jgi:tRNA-specific 2-thiouridylase
MNAKRKRIIVGMSGGVDSSVSALLLQQQGHVISGLFMKNWEDNDPEAPCPAAIDAEDAMQVCIRLDIDFDAVNFAAEYWERVFTHFLDEYHQGRTPNPDVLCNREIKFKAFLDYALEQGAEYIATGHYARIDKQGHRYRLLKGQDASKDQSYFLYLLNQQQLSRSLFPLGELNKNEVRNIAARNDFANHNKKDSTGICFIGERKFNEFLQTYLPARPGEIRGLDDELLGEHQGLMFHTIGQRKGLGIGGQRETSGHDNNNGAAWFVIAKDMKQNILRVAQGHDHPLLFSSALIADQSHWISGTTPAWPLHCHAKIRYRQPDQACTVTIIDEQYLHVSFDQPQRAVSPGQSIVFYHGDECLGGAIIDSSTHNHAATPQSKDHSCCHEPYIQ